MDEIVVARITESRGPKSDKRDAHGLSGPGGGALGYSFTNVAFDGTPWSVTRNSM